MRIVGGARVWIGAAFMLGLAVAIAALYVGPWQSARPSPPVAGTVDPPTARPTLPGKIAQTVIPDDSGDPVVYLAPLGEFPEEVLTDLADYVTAKYQIDVELLLPSSPDSSAFDAERDQYVTEALLDGLARTYRKADPGDGSVVIGVLADDVYILDRTDWAWAFGMRGDDGYAVFSTARMGSLAEPIEPIVMSRIRKMVLRDIGVLYYGLPLNDDPLSVLYRDVLGVDDLDRMGEDFCGSECPSRAATGGVASLP